MEWWDLAGHASDLYPFSTDIQSTSEIDVNAEGTQYFLRLASQGQVALANWKKRDLRFLRFRNLYISKNLELGVDEDTEYTITRNSATQFEVDPTQTGWVFDVDTLENSLMIYGGSKYKVMSVTEVSPTSWIFYVFQDVGETEDVVYPETLTEIQFAVNEFTVTSSASAPTNTYQIILPERVYSILRIDDYATQTEILKANNREDLATKGNANTTGTPQYYLNLGSKIIFDTALDEKRWFKFELFQQPAAITTLDESLTIPEPFHQALVFWGMWKISLRNGKDIPAVNYRRLVDNELLSTRDEYDNEFERSKTYGLKIRRE
jgi:hypothetical protein